MTDCLTVLDAERTLLEAQDRLAESETLTATALVAVYKALGGGWEIAPKWPTRWRLERSQLGPRRSPQGRLPRQHGRQLWTHHPLGTRRARSVAGQKVEQMLKITIHEAAGPLRIELEGRLAGAWVCELEHCWRAAQASHPNRTLAVDLTGVTFIDQAGRYLLQLMHHDGVSLVGSGLMLQDVLDHIRGSTV